MRKMPWMLFYLFLINIPVITSRDLSRKQPRRLLDLLVQGVHSITSECPNNILPDGIGLNHSDILPLNPELREVFNSILTPITLNASFGLEIARVASFSELVISWWGMNALQLESPVLQDSLHLKTFLQPMLQAFVQTENLYFYGSHSKIAVVSPVKSSILTVVLCSGSNLALHVSSRSVIEEYGGGIAPAPPKDLCLRFSDTKEQNASLIQISPTYKTLGYWAPLHCRPKIPTHKIMFHLVVPIPIMKGLNLIFEFDIRNLTLDLCAAGLDFCRHSITQCVYRQYKTWPFDVGNYVCQCKPGFWIGNSENGYTADMVEQRVPKNRGKNGSGAATGVERMSCKVCSPDCPNCTSGRSCGVEYNMQLLRGIPLAVQTFSITSCLFLGIVTFRVRRTRVFKAANWLFLELYLLGAILLYFTTIVMYFRASTPTCILLPWLREMGFSMMYGVLIVKLYRVLLSFQSRKAHRVHVRDKDLFKYLGCFIAIVVGYMVAWTAVNLDYTRFSQYGGIQTPQKLPTFNPSGLPLPSIASAGVQESGLGSMLVKGRIEARVTSETPISSPPTTVTSAGNSTSERLVVVWKRDFSHSVHYQYFRVCRALSWDIVVEIGEILILFLGVHYCRLIWSAPSEYQENRCITIALLAELVVSGTLYLTRHFIWYSVHPDIVFIIYFFRCHLTVSLNIAIIFGLKFWYIHKPPTPPPLSVGRGMVGAVPGASAAPHLVPSNKLRLASNGELDLADVNLADMDPEVIRRELKRLYTAIEIYKTKAMRRDNPHISKRRGGRKQRRFSLQPFHKKHHGGHGGAGSSIVTGTGGGVSESMIDPSSNVGPGWGDHTSMNLKIGKGVVMRSGCGGSHSNYPSMALDEEVSRVSEGEGSMNESMVDEHDQQSTAAGSPLSQQNFNSTSQRYTNPNIGYSRGQKRH